MFHGREWDANAGHYYYRFRTYIPEYGSFTGPDMNLANGIEGEPNIIGSFVFCGNDPVNCTDPTGLLLQGTAVTYGLGVIYAIAAGSATYLMMPPSARTSLGESMGDAFTDALDVAREADEAPKRAATWLAWKAVDYFANSSSASAPNPGPPNSGNKIVGFCVQNWAEDETQKAFDNAGIYLPFVMFPDPMDGLRLATRMGNMPNRPGPWMSPPNRLMSYGPMRRAATTPSQAAEGGVIRWTPLNGPGPLGKDMAKTFRSATYTEFIAEEPIVLYRVWGGRSKELRAFWTRTKPKGPLQTQIDSAVLPGFGNTFENLTTIRVPAGTRLFEGVAARQAEAGIELVGGGNQIVVPMVDPSWIVR
jgi:RHS repeat-associated protein